MAAAAFLFRFEYRAWRFRDVIGVAAERYGVPPRLIAAVAWQETHFRPYVVGRAGELGLMQVTPAAGLEWAKAEQRLPFSRADLLDPRTNLLAGTWYLKRALNRWQAESEPVSRALAEYNAGRSNAVRWDRNTPEGEPLAAAITYPTTRRYVQSVLLHYRTFGRPWRRWNSQE